MVDLGDLWGDFLNSLPTMPSSIHHLCAPIKDMSFLLHQLITIKKRIVGARKIVFAHIGEDEKLEDLSRFRADSLRMRNYSPLPSLLFLQQHNSGFSQSPAPDSSISLQMCSNLNEVGSHSEGLESTQSHLNHAGSVLSSGFSYFTPAAPTMNYLVPPMINQCSSSNAEKERHFGQPFQSDMLRDPRKRPFEDFVPREGIFSMISNTTFPGESHPSKRKAFEPQLLKAPVRRSQKLSDKITSLQKVVSPYGKTDTASVLQEACMYIKIAHQDIRRLTVSHFGTRTIQPQLMHSNLEKWYPDLQSKGLCLAPLSMTTQLSLEDPPDGSNQGVSKIMNSWGF